MGGDMKMIPMLKPSMDPKMNFMDITGVAAWFYGLQYVEKYVKVDDHSPMYNAYAGVIITILFSNLAAMYLSVKTVEIGMDWAKKNALFFLYH